MYCIYSFEPVKKCISKIRRFHFQPCQPHDKQKLRSPPRQLRQLLHHPRHRAGQHVHRGLGWTPGAPKQFCNSFRPKSKTRRAAAQPKTKARLANVPSCRVPNSKPSSDKDFFRKVASACLAAATMTKSRGELWMGALSLCNVDSLSAAFIPWIFHHGLLESKSSNWGFVGKL